MSTNKVYGDRPNTIALSELETRWDYADPAYAHGIAETSPSTSASTRSSARPKSRATSWSRSTAAISTCRPAASAAAASPAEPFRRRTARLSELPREVQSGRAGVQGLRVQGQAGARQHPLAGRRALHVRVLRAPAWPKSTTWAAAGERLLHPRGLRAGRSLTGKPHALRATSTRTASATTSATTATCARCRRTIPAGTSLSRSSRRPPRLSSRGTSGWMRPINSNMPSG